MKDENNDIEKVRTILAEMGASFKSIEKRGETHLKGWIVNKDDVGVAWVIFEHGHYTHIRFHRSSYEFNCKELELRLENMTLNRSVEYYKNALCDATKQLRDIEIEKERKVNLCSYFIIY